MDQQQQQQQRARAPGGGGGSGLDLAVLNSNPNRDRGNGRGAGGAGGLGLGLGLQLAPARALAAAAPGPGPLNMFGFGRGLAAGSGSAMYAAPTLIDTMGSAGEKLGYSFSKEMKEATIADLRATRVNVIEELKKECAEAALLQAEADSKKDEHTGNLHACNCGRRELSRDA